MCNLSLHYSAIPFKNTTHIDVYSFSLSVFRFLVRVSYLEIYNEEVRDLLGKDQHTRLEVTHKDNMHWVKGYE